MTNTSGIYRLHHYNEGYYYFMLYRNGDVQQCKASCWDEEKQCPAAFIPIGEAGDWDKLAHTQWIPECFSKGLFRFNANVKRIAKWSLLIKESDLNWAINSNKTS